MISKKQYVEYLVSTPFNASVSPNIGKNQRMLKTIIAFGLAIVSGVLANLICQNLIMWLASTWFDDRGLMWFASHAGFAAIGMVLVIYPVLFILNGALYPTLLSLLGSPAKASTRETREKIWLGGFVALLAHVIGVLSGFFLALISISAGGGVAFLSGLLLVILLPLFLGACGGWLATRYFKPAVL
jgi:hypothetical protein